MSRHPISRDWKGLAAFLVAAFFVFGVFLGASYYLAAVAAVIAALVASGIYLTGESSGLPGTSGDHDKDIPT